MSHSHLHDPFPEDFEAACLHLYRAHGVGVHPSVPWGKVAMTHANLHAQAGQVKPDDRPTDQAEAASPPDDNRPDSGSAPA